MRQWILKLAYTAILTSTASMAAVTPEEAKQLGENLTTWGAEKAGNKSGTIPAYTGEILKAPAGFDPNKTTARLDIYAKEKPLYTVTEQNMGKYANVLSEGMVAMLQKYPSFHIEVYPTHRTVRHPTYIQDNSFKNATSCKTFNNGLTLEKCAAGVPFPIAKTGNEMMWNHILHYGTTSLEGEANYILVDGSGNRIPQGTNTCSFEYPFVYPENKGQYKGDSPYLMTRCDTGSPARKTGEKILLIDHMDQINVGRRAWTYIPGQRRVKLAPILAYDTPNPQSGGASLMDDLWLFTGAQDRFDFKLMGKREMLIPYNSFKSFNSDQCPQDKMLTKNHLNPECVRFELHRVWEVEATLKPEFRHAYIKRKFYIDEDLSGAGWADNFDSSGKLQRSSLTLFIPWYETADQGTADSFMVFDHRTGAYMANVNYFHPTDRKESRYFSPEAISSSGVR